MSKQILSIIFACLLAGQLFAQAPQSAAADDYNSISKP